MSAPYDSSYSAQQIMTKYTFKSEESWLTYNRPFIQIQELKKKKKKRKSNNKQNQLTIFSDTFFSDDAKKCFMKKNNSFFMNNRIESKNFN